MPACLSFLTIYNPSLRTSDEITEEQIVYHYSKQQNTKKGSRGAIGADKDSSKDAVNERLRQVGLAQGMIQFAQYVLKFKMRVGLVADCGVQRICERPAY